MIFSYKKYLLVAFAVVFTVALVFFLLSGYKKEKTEYDAGIFKGFGYVPVDASGIFSFERFDSAVDLIGRGNSLFGEIVFDHSEILPFISMVSEISYMDRGEMLKDNKMMISLHYSAKNELSSLVMIILEGDSSLYHLMERSGTYSRSYNGMKMRKYEGIEYFVTDSLIVASASAINIESSVRHLRSNASIMDNPDFQELLLKNTKSGNMFYLNNTQAGKIFSGLADMDYLKYADFVSKFASWSIFDIVSEKDYFVLDGEFLNDKGAGNYSHSFLESVSVQSESLRILPAHTYLLFTVSVRDPLSFSRKYGEFLKYHRRQSGEISEKASVWLKELDAREISLAMIPYGGVFHSVTLVKKGGKGFISRMFGKSESDTKIEPFDKKGYVSALFGEIFRNNDDDYCFEDDEWLIIGPEVLLKEFSSGSFLYFTMDEYISQTKAYGLLEKKKPALSLIVNGSGYPDSLIRPLRKNYRAGMESFNRKKNLMIYAFQLYGDKENSAGGRIIALIDSVVTLPSPPEVNSDIIVPEWEKNVSVHVPSGPFELINFNNGEKEYLVQLDNNWLRLEDKDRKGIWAAPFHEPLGGYVEQVDFYNNGKLQMLFAGSNQLNLLDRTGRFVSPFPVEIAYEITLGPKVYYPNDSGQYAVMLLHADNTLRLYDRFGKVYPAWSDITLDETIKDFPELIVVNGLRYWLLRTSLKSMIYSVNGIPVTEISGSNRLSPNTDVIHIDGDAVRVTTVARADFRLRLETGEMKKIKK